MFLLRQLGKTACHYAAEYGHVDVLGYLYHFVEKRVCPQILPEVSERRGRRRRKGRDGEREGGRDYIPVP